MFCGPQTNTDLACPPALHAQQLYLTKAFTVINCSPFKVAPPEAVHLNAFMCPMSLVFLLCMQLNNLGAVAKAMPLSWGNAEETRAVLEDLGNSAQSSEGPDGGNSSSGGADVLGGVRYPDIVLASDVVYKMHEVDLLFSTIAALLGPPGAKQDWQHGQPPDAGQQQTGQTGLELQQLGQQELDEPPIPGQEQRQQRGQERHQQRSRFALLSYEDRAGAEGFLGVLRQHGLEEEKVRSIGNAIPMAASSICTEYVPACAYRSLTWQWAKQQQVNHTLLCVCSFLPGPTTSTAPGLAGR